MFHNLPLVFFKYSVVHFTITKDDDRDLLNQIVTKIENLEQNLSDYEKADSKRDLLTNELESTKASLKQLCSQIELESIHAQIDECGFKFNEKALERLAAPLPTTDDDDEQINV